MNKDCVIDISRTAGFKTSWLTPSADAAVANLVDVQRSSLVHLPLADPRAYHRSKIITATTGINPLTTAATALLTHISKLCTQAHCDDIATLYVDLQHEIKAFEAHAQILGYRSDIILLARYMLCTTLDEIILATEWGQQSQWHQHKLLHLFHNEDWGGERFFIILRRLCADPALHIDILELAYLCLSLGYTGKYQLNENGYRELEQITEHLYQCIHWHRGDIKKELLITLEPKPTPVTKIKKQTTPPWLFNTLLATLLSSFYLIFNFLLGQAAAPLYQQLSSL